MSRGREEVFFRAGQPPTQSLSTRDGGGTMSEIVVPRSVEPAAAAVPAAAGDGRPVQPARIVGLDAMRALLLSYGVLVHTSNVKLEPIFTFVEQSSGLFRMNAFFFLSGLLTALTMDRLPLNQWLRGRLLALGVPLAFGLAVLNPLFFLVQNEAPKTSFMIGFVARNHFDGYLHLWFLFSLIVFTLIAYAIRRREGRGGHTPRLERALLIPSTAHRSLSLLALICALPIVYFPVTFLVRRLDLAPLGVEGVGFVVTSTVRALPFYLFGFIVPRHALARALFSSRIYLLVGLLSIPTLAIEAGLWNPPGNVSTIIGGIGRPAFSIAFILIVTPWFLRMKTIPAALRALSKSAYTIYIVHLVLVSVFLYGFAWLGLGIHPAAAATVVCVFAVALGIHFGLVERFRWARFLLNGRLK